MGVFGVLYLNYQQTIAKVRFLLAISLSVFLAIILTGCNSDIWLSANASQSPQLVDAILSDPKTFNPILASDATSSGVGGMMFDGLVEQNPITGEIEPALAESWEMSEDKLKITFNLRKNLKWSDGEPLTADDVDFTYNQLYLNEAIPSGERDVIRVGESKALPKVRKVNDLQVEFTISEPFAPFLGTTGALSIYPSHILQESVTKLDPEGQPLFLSTWTVDTPPAKLVGNAAYKLKNYSTSQRLIFEKNPYYWKRQATALDLPYIDRVIWEIVESTDTFLLQFRSGGLDSMSVAPEYFSLLKKEENKGNFTIYNGGPNYGTSFITFNLNRGSRNGKPLVDPVKSRWFNNVNFRQAIAYAIDRPRMVNNIFRGLGQPQTSFVSVQSPFYYEGVKTYDYNLEKAKKLLLTAGFTYNKKQQLVDDRGNRVEFILYTNTGNKIRESMGNQIEEDLGKLGIKVNFRTINFNVLIGKLDESYDWECILLGFTGGNEPNNGANMWSPEGSSHLFNQAPQAGQKSLENRIIEDWEREIDLLFIEAARELDETKRKAIYAEAQQLVAEQVPLIYLVNPLSLSAVRNNIKGIEYSALGGAFWNLDSLKIEE
jgi:peptide/nickel transport system substrate-binding protein